MVYIPNRSPLFLGVHTAAAVPLLRSGYYIYVPGLERNETKGESYLGV